MNNREVIIKRYFESWIKGDISILDKIFDLNIVYSECYGPEYKGIESLKKWFEDWHNKGRVLIWNIKQFIHKGNISVVEWYFKCNYDGDISEFDGVSLIEFDKKNCIVNLKEFQSKLPHYYPYK